MGHNYFEAALGGLVLIVAAIFLVFAYRATGFWGQGQKGYEVTAQFGRSGGISAGADVRVSGVKVGSVTGTSLDPSSFLAVISMSLDPGIRLPSDTLAAIRSESLLGGRYVSLEPGVEEDMIRSGGRIYRTANPVDLEDLVGRFVFSSGASSSGQGQPSAGGDRSVPQGSRP